MLLCASSTSSATISKASHLISNDCRLLDGIDVEVGILVGAGRGLGREAPICQAHLPVRVTVRGFYSCYTIAQLGARLKLACIATTSLTGLVSLAAQLAYKCMNTYIYIYIYVHPHAQSTNYVRIDTCTSNLTSSTKLRQVVSPSLALAR